jgi:hypothetical protein
MKSIQILIPASIMAIVTLGLTVPSTIAATLTVNQTGDPNQLQRILFGDAPPIQISRFDISAKISGGYGQFSQGGFLGLDQGLVMSTGEIASIARKNCADGRVNLTCNPLKPGADLNYDFAIFDEMGNIVENPLDSIILDIAFVAPRPGSLDFKYVFGSEEFPEFRLGQQIGNDIFYLMLADQNGNLLFDQATSIDSIVAANAFKSNPAGGGEIALDGYTDPLSAIIPFKAQQQYRLILGIQDAQIARTIVGPDGQTETVIESDDGYDSAVFLQQISVNMDPVASVPTPSLLFGFTWMGWRRWRDRRKRL